jgi:Zn-dependent oligopeptidase
MSEEIRREVVLITPEQAQAALEAGRDLARSGAPLTAEQRARLKTLAFGAAYGQSAAGLAQDARSSERPAS